MLWIVLLLLTVGQRATETYKGFTIDVSVVSSDAERKTVLAEIHDQLDIVDGVKVSPETRAFFKTVPIVITPGTGSALYSSNGRVGVPLHSNAHYDTSHPILLHELCHAYHDKKLGGFKNAEVLGLYRAAKSGGRFPSRSYMLSNPAEYFAMMASVYLYGSAMRDPFARDSIRTKQPEMYRFLIREFGSP